MLEFASQLRIQSLWLYSISHHCIAIGEYITHSNCSDGEIRLAGKVTTTSGRLEICYNKVWGTVCSRGWELKDSYVACRELGFHQNGNDFVTVDVVAIATIVIFEISGLPISTSSPFFAGYGSGPIFLYRTSCLGSESALRECTSTSYPLPGTYCNHFYDLTLNCTGMTFYHFSCNTT